MKHLTCILLLFLAFADFASAQSVKIAYPKNYPPYSQELPNGKANGALIDIYRLWAEISGYTIEFIPATFEESMQMVKEGKADIAAAAIRETDSEFSYGQTLIRLSTSLYLKEDLVPDSSIVIEDSIGIYVNSKVANLVETRLTGIKIKKYNSLKIFLRDIEEKEIAGFIYELPDPIDGELKTRIPEGYYSYIHLLSEELRPALRASDSTLLRKLVEGTLQINPEDLENIVIKHDLFIQPRSNNQLYYVLPVLILIVIGVVVIRRKTASKGVSSEIDYKSLIQNGETDKVEFKSSLRWDYHQSKVNKVLEGVIVKVISSFLNTNGGTLFIGVDDDGNILGLQHDYESMSKKNRDGFLLSLTNLINNQLGKDSHRLLTIRIIELEDKEICVVHISPGDKPVFLGKKDQEEFYIRASASSQPLSMSEAYEYIRKRWSN